MKKIIVAWNSFSNWLDENPVLAPIFVIILWITGGILILFILGTYQGILFYIGLQLVIIIILIKKWPLKYHKYRIVSVAIYIIVSSIIIFIITKPDELYNNCINYYDNIDSSLTSYDKATICNYEKRGYEYFEKGEIQKADQEFEESNDYKEHLKLPEEQQIPDFIKY
ncbi:MAG: hypothetical protein WCT33_05040 [Patescibacteria group bacterium]|jgi:hypothetical protein